MTQLERDALRLLDCVLNLEVDDVGCRTIPPGFLDEARILVEENYVPDYVKD